ncbi:hypothetical protein AAHE18_01G164600 [Arachis hypogaea]
MDAAPPSTTCGQQPASKARSRTPQRFHPVNVVTGPLIKVSPISTTATSCHPGAKNKGVLLLTKSALLLLHVAVGSAIKASLFCSDEHSRTSTAPASKSCLT